MSVSITWHGHANFQLAHPACNVLVDPFFMGCPTAVTTWNSIAQPDVVLVTHLHGDHAGDVVDICRKTGAALGVVVGAAEILQSSGVPQAQIVNGIGFNIGGTVEVKGAKITDRSLPHHRGRCAHRLHRHLPGRFHRVPRGRHRYFRQHGGLGRIVRYRSGPVAERRRFYHGPASGRSGRKNAAGQSCRAHALGNFSASGAKPGCLPEGIGRPGAELSGHRHETRRNHYAVTGVKQLRHEGGGKRDIHDYEF